MTEDLCQIVVCCASLGALLYLLAIILKQKFFFVNVSRKRETAP